MWEQFCTEGALRRVGRPCPLDAFPKREQSTTDFAKHGLFKRHIYKLLRLETECVNFHASVFFSVAGVIRMRGLGCGR